MLARGGYGAVMGTSKWMIDLHILDIHQFLITFSLLDFSISGQIAVHTLARLSVKSTQNLRDSRHRCPIIHCPSRIVSHSPVTRGRDCASSTRGSWSSSSPEQHRISWLHSSSHFAKLRHASRLNCHTTVLGWSCDVPLLSPCSCITLPWVWNLFHISPNYAVGHIEICRNMLLSQFLL